MTENEVIIELIKRGNKSNNLWIGYRPDRDLWAKICTEGEYEDLRKIADKFEGEVQDNDRTVYPKGPYLWVIFNAGATRVCRLLVVRPEFRSLTWRYATAVKIIQYADMLACA